MQVVLSFMRLVNDVSRQFIKSDRQRKEVIEFIKMMVPPTEKELDAFDNIIRKCDYSILDNREVTITWEAGNWKPIEDKDLIKMFEYDLLSGDFYGNGTGIESLLEGIYDWQQIEVGSEYHEVNEMINTWFKKIMEKVFPFFEADFINTPYNGPSWVNRDNLRAHSNLLRLASIYPEFSDSSTQLTIRSIIHPEIDGDGCDYNEDVLLEFAKIIRSGGYKKVINAFCSDDPYTNVILGARDISMSHELTKEEKGKLTEFMSKMQYFLTWDNIEIPEWDTAQIDYESFMASLNG